MVVKAAIPRHFSIVVYGLVQITLDLEVLWYLAQGHYPVHRLWHTYVGATVLAAVWTALGKPASQWIKTAWNCTVARWGDADLTVSVPTSWLASFAGASLGAYGHILLDSLVHSDIEPLQPWSAANRLREIVNSHSLGAVCLALGIVGLVGFVERLKRKQKVRKRPVV
jgi:hypothetical protein